MKPLLVSFFVLAALALPLTASAGGKKGKAHAVECTDRVGAKRDFDAGHLAYRRGEYEEAILKFQDSFEACKEPLTLLAIANAYERLGDLEATLEHLETFRPDADPAEHAELDNRIATLESRLAEQENDEAEREAKAEREAEEERKRREAAEQEDDAGPLTYAGWITGGVGVAMLAGSFVTGVWTLSVDGDLADDCADGECSSDKTGDVDQLSTLTTATDVLMVLGTTLTVGGISMLLLDSSSDSSTSVGFTFGPGQGGASVRQSF